MIIIEGKFIELSDGTKIVIEKSEEIVKFGIRGKTSDRKTRSIFTSLAEEDWKKLVKFFKKLEENDV